MKPGKDKWIERAENSIEGLQPARPNNPLYNKVKARIAAYEQSPVGKVVPMSTVYGIAAGLALLVAVNAVSWISLSKKQTPTNTTVLKAFANEYLLTGNSYNY